MKLSRLKNEESTFIQEHSDRLLAGIGEHQKKYLRPFLRESLDLLLTYFKTQKIQEAQDDNNNSEDAYLKQATQHANNLPIFKEWLEDDAFTLQNVLNYAQTIDNKFLDLPDWITFNFDQKNTAAEHPLEVTYLSRPLQSQINQYAEIQTSQTQKEQDIFAKLATIDLRDFEEFNTKQKETIIHFLINFKKLNVTIFNYLTPDELSYFQSCLYVEEVDSIDEETPDKLMDQIVTFVDKFPFLRNKHHVEILKDGSLYQLVHKGCLQVGEAALLPQEKINIFASNVQNVPSLPGISCESIAKADIKKSKDDDLSELELIAKFIETHSKVAEILNDYPDFDCTKLLDLNSSFLCRLPEPIQRLFFESIISANEINFLEEEKLSSEDKPGKRYLLPALENRLVFGCIASGVFTLNDFSNMLDEQLANADIFAYIKLQDRLYNQETVAKKELKELFEQDPSFPFAKIELSNILTIAALENDQLVQVVKKHPEFLTILNAIKYPDVLAALVTSAKFEQNGLIPQLLDEKLTIADVNQLAADLKENVAADVFVKINFNNPDVKTILTKYQHLKWPEDLVRQNEIIDILNTVDATTAQIFLDSQVLFKLFLENKVSIDTIKQVEHSKIKMLDQVLLHAEANNFTQVPAFFLKLQDIIDNTVLEALDSVNIRVMFQTRIRRLLESASSKRESFSAASKERELISLAESLKAYQPLDEKSLLALIHLPEIQQMLMKDAKETWHKLTQLSESSIALLSAQYSDSKGVTLENSFLTKFSEPQNSLSVNLLNQFPIAVGKESRAKLKDFDIFEALKKNKISVQELVTIDIEQLRFITNPKNKPTKLYKMVITNKQISPEKLNKIAPHKLNFVKDLSDILGKLARLDDKQFEQINSLDTFTLTLIEKDPSILTKILDGSLTLDVLQMFMAEYVQLQLSYMQLVVRKSLTEKKQDVLTAIDLTLEELLKVIDIDTFQFNHFFDTNALKINNLITLVTTKPLPKGFEDVFQTLQNTLGLLTNLSENQELSLELLLTNTINTKLGSIDVLPLQYYQANIESSFFLGATKNLRAARFVTPENVKTTLATTITEIDTIKTELLETASERSVEKLNLGSTKVDTFFSSAAKTNPAPKFSTVNSFYENNKNALSRSLNFFPPHASQKAEWLEKKEAALKQAQQQEVKETPKPDVDVTVVTDNNNNNGSSHEEVPSSTSPSLGQSQSTT